MSETYRTPLERAMNDRGLTADDLHKAVGGHRNDVNQWISGARLVPALRCDAVVDFIALDWFSKHDLRDDWVVLKQA